MRQIIIDGKTITEDSDPYVIAEIGSNHMGSIELCKKLFLEAKRCGADAIKLQKRDNKGIFTKKAYDAPYQNENSYGPSYGLHREALEFGDKEYFELYHYAKEIGITFFATAFDEKSADFLESYGVPAHKIASADLINLPLIEHIASFNKPLIISTGGGTWEDIDRVYERLNGKVLFSFLHCVATYPNKAEELNLRVIETMKKRYPDVVIGYSNHHPSTFINLAAYMAGARIIEVHFTLNRASKGTDHALSLEPKGLETLCDDVKRLRLAMGAAEKIVLPSEEAAIRKMGKSIWPVKPIKAGEKITPDKVALKSPGGSLPPYELENILGKVSIVDLSTCNPITMEDLR